MRLALFIIVTMALLHKARMSSSLDESESCSTSLACVCVCLVYWESVASGLLVVGLGIIRLAVFLSRVMRFSCLLSDVVMGGCSLVLVTAMDG